MDGLLSFNLGNGPCLRWKLVAAVKLQWGWPGFVAPYQTRYLTKVVTITAIPTFGYGTPDPGAPIVSSSRWTLDRLTNESTQTILTNGGADADFSYGTDLTPDPTHNESWVVSETNFVHVYNNGYNYITTEVQLSDPYDTATLETDANNFLAAADVTDQPWQTWQTVGEITSPFFITIPNAALPVQFRNAGSIVSGPSTNDPTQLRRVVCVCLWRRFAGVLAAQRLHEMH